MLKINDDSWNLIEIGFIKKKYNIRLSRKTLRFIERTTGLRSNMGNDKLQPINYNQFTIYKNSIQYLYILKL